MPISRINSRSSKIDSCSLKIEDFRSLFNLLADKIIEALKFELEKSQFIKQVPEDSKEEIEQNIRNLFKLSVHIVGSKGEYLVGDEASIFDDAKFPSKINQIIFDSSYYFKQVTNQEPMNKVIIQFDIKRQDIFDFSNPITEPNKNISSVTVSGLDDTWVSGVYAEISSFLQERRNNRNWLHRKHIYDLFLYLLFYPIVFWLLYRVSNLLQGKVIAIFLIAIYLYIFILLLYLLRILFNYTRWIFPLIEFIPQSRTKMIKHRATLWFIILTIIASFAADIIKSIFKHY